MVYFVTDNKKIISAADSKAGGKDYLLLFLQAKSIAEKQQKK